MISLHTCKELSQQYALGYISPVEVVEKALNMMQTKEAKNVFISITSKRAIAAAKRSQLRYKNKNKKGNLDGTTVVWKDLFDQKGEITTAGSLTRKNAQKANKDSVTVDLLEASGACSLGRTNLSEFAFSGIGINPHFGTPSSALSSSEKNLPGGSSSGSAVAVALGISQIGIGTDTSGSVRIPAALNGIIGFRSTSSRYNQEGVFPLSKQLDSIGILARNLSDIIEVDKVLTKNNSSISDFTVSPTVIFDATEILKTISKVQWTDKMFSAYTFALRTFEKNGYPVKTITSTELPTILHTVKEFEKRGTLVAIDAKFLHRHLLQSKDTEFMDPMVLRRMKLSPTITKDKYLDYLNVRKELILQTNSILNNAIIACPTVPSLHHNKAYYVSNEDAASELNTNLLKSTMIGSFLDMPGVTLPIKNKNTNKTEGSILLSVAQGKDSELLLHAKNLFALLFK